MIAVRRAVVLQAPGELLSVGDLEIEGLRRQGRWKTHEDVEREQRETEDTERRRQQGVLGKLKDLVRAS